MRSLSVTIQMKATEQYFAVVLFNILYKMITFQSMNEIPKCYNTSELAVEQHQPVSR